MDVTLQQSNLSNYPGGSIVSILVLMDVTLQPIWNFASGATPGCFNPCFNGCYSSTSIKVIEKISKAKFQSLF